MPDALVHSSVTNRKSGPCAENHALSRYTSLLCSSAVTLWAICSLGLYQHQVSCVVVESFVHVPAGLMKAGDLSTFPPWGSMSYSGYEPPAPLTGSAFLSGRLKKSSHTDRGDVCTSPSDILKITLFADFKWANEEHGNCISMKLFLKRKSTRTRLPACLCIPAPQLPGWSGTSYLIPPCLSFFTSKLGSNHPPEERNWPFFTRERFLERIKQYVRVATCFAFLLLQNMATGLTHGG